MASQRPAAAPEPEAPFDERMQRLEALVAKLESGELPLEQALERYQEGIALLRGCHATLASFRRRVEELSREADAARVAFEGDPDAPAAPAPDRAPPAAGGGR
jgi:exodeoxyribonuclease VII small subunit